MSFLYPGFLFALFAISIPIIIHLFHFRRFRTVYFTNVKYLKELKEETGSRDKLKHLLVLISRILAISFLVFAFAQPFLKSKDRQVTVGAKAVGIYIDNSFSMDAMAEDRSLLDQAKAKAKEIVGSYSEIDRFQLITNDFLGKHQRLLSKEEVNNALDEVGISPVSRDLEEVFARQKEVMASAGFEDRQLFWISDFQKRNSVFENDTNYQVHLLPLKGVEQSNVSLDTCWLDAPVLTLNQNAKTIVRITNHGKEDVEEAGLSLKINGQVKAEDKFAVEAGGSITDTLYFKINGTGWQECEVFITDYPISFDDSYFLSFRVRENTRVLAINGSNLDPNITGLFNAKAEFILDNSNANNVNYSALPEYDLVILNGIDRVSTGLTGELKKVLEAGNNILILPSTNLDVSSWNNLSSSLQIDRLSGLVNAKKEVGTINHEHDLFIGVFEEYPRDIRLPSVKSYHQMNTGSGSRGEPVLRFKDGSPFLSEFRVENGSVYLSTVGFSSDYSDLQSQALFPLLLHNMAIFKRNKDILIQTLGKGDLVEIPSVGNKDDVFRISMNELEYIPEQRRIGARTLISLGEQANLAGVYQITSGTEVLAKPALNYDREESELAFLNSEELESAFGYRNVEVISSVEGNLGELVSRLSRGRALWKLCIIFALAFLAAEILIIRFWPA